MAKRHPGEPGWAWRRWVIFPNLILSYGVLCYLVLYGADTELSRMIASGCLWNIYGSIVIYTGFATAQDVTAMMATRSGLPYSPVSSPAEPPPAPEVTVQSGAKVEVQAG